MKSGLSVGLFYNCQPVGMGLWFGRKLELTGAGSKAKVWEFNSGKSDCCLPAGIQAVTLLLR